MKIGVSVDGINALYGPIVASCVALPYEFYDEKIFSEKEKWKLLNYIKEKAITHSTYTMCADEVNSLGEKTAKIECIHKALDNLDLDEKPLLLVNISKFKQYKDWEYKFMRQKKDIALVCAKIISKTIRNDLIYTMCSENPSLNEYNIRKNKGYSDYKHKKALIKYWITKDHRENNCNRLLDSMLRTDKHKRYF